MAAHKSFLQRVNCYIIAIIYHSCQSLLKEKIHEKFMVIHGYSCSVADKILNTNDHELNMNYL